MYFIDQIVRALLHMTNNAQNQNFSPTLGRACIMMRIVLLLLVTFSWAVVGFEPHASFNDTVLPPTSEVGLDGSELTLVPTIQHGLAEASHVSGRDRTSDANDDSANKCQAAGCCMSFCQSTAVLDQSTFAVAVVASREHWLYHQIFLKRTAPAALERPPRRS